MDYAKVGIITSQNTQSGTTREQVVIRGNNLLGNGTCIKRVTLAGVLGRVIFFNNYEIYLYAGRCSSNLQGEICIENDIGEVICGGSWKYN
jgi:hypothetical protein